MMTFNAVVVFGLIENKCNNGWEQGIQAIVKSNIKGSMPLLRVTSKDPSHSTFYGSLSTASFCIIVFILPQTTFVQR